MMDAKVNIVIVMNVGSVCTVWVFEYINATAAWACGCQTISVLYFIIQAKTHISYSLI